MYINDICNASTILKFKLFADDTNVFYSGVDIQTLCECISRELDKFHVWLSVNKLSLNVVTLLPCPVESHPTPGDIRGSSSPSRSISGVSSHVADGGSARVLHELLIKQILFYLAIVKILTMCVYL